ncbi:polysaccharide pyruvyl transferase family protein [Amycolatopsis sp. FDAARGOS 1241]|uniref:polysaccharide pyruvyl transferase family protein n=1 Tax=Amycolatopsis sp. FDAARGOS 1241 TaxID=2778070 RepID=UPI0019519F74|nr:polysaccharide pyruvyl transferase family protein [Amycolatopsis sp. FDAARGOS 1241]QRP49723.1 polysaccharide pyruvyl transferase family protein [Amycolatopsis sp. FDAARGOS 1241]
MRVLLTGWASFLHGEATAGDVLSLRAAGAALSAAGIEHDVAWSPGFRPDRLHLGDAAVEDYTHVVFACGPVHGPQLRELHERYASCRRIAVGVSVADPADAAVTGFHRILPRDDAATAVPDLSLAATTSRAPVLGIVLASRQPEYGAAGRHDEVHAALTQWLAGLDCARVPLDTRLAHENWTRCATPDQFVSALSRVDVVVTTRLHGLALGLKAGVPVCAVDPVAGGGKVTAQGRALHWPVLAANEAGDAALLDEHLAWCLSRGGPAPAVPGAGSSLDGLIDELVGQR